MKIYLIRHAEASHLKEDWKKNQLSRREFMAKLHAWDDAMLTEKGRQDAQKISEKLPDSATIVFSSPLQRSVDTAKNLVSLEHEVLLEDNLREIVTYPLKIFAFTKFSTLVWIYFCIFSCFFSGFACRIIREALYLFKLFRKQSSVADISDGHAIGDAQSCVSTDVVAVSHAMRIRSLVYLSHFLPGYKTIKKDYTPCGITIIEIREES